MSFEDDAQIRALLLRASYLADEGSPDDYDQIYADDATWSAGGSTQNGVAEIIASSHKRRTEGRTGPGSHNRHVVIPVSVTVDGDTAESVSYFMFVGQTDEKPVIRMFATYRDKLRRTPDGWRISERINQSE